MCDLDRRMVFSVVEHAAKYERAADTFTEVQVHHGIAWCTAARPQFPWCRRFTTIRYHHRNTETCRQQSA